MNYGPPDHLARSFLDLNWDQPVPDQLNFPVAPFCADQGFVERAAMFSCFGGAAPGAQFGLAEAAKTPRISRSQSLNHNVAKLDIDDADAGKWREESSPSGPNSGEGNAKKRKAATRMKGKDPLKIKEACDIDAKRCRSPKEQAGDGAKEGNAEAVDPHKDYIHVRARRGQATDSHSLAERVRREKISERMKLLQDIVPGCNKVTGKAIMLDEIINYVQSLQRQVEFLSMKLASVNTFETAVNPTPYPQLAAQGTSLQCQVNPLESLLHRTLDEFGNAASQLRNFWEDDLQNVVQMGYEQNQERAYTSQGFHGM